MSFLRFIRFKKIFLAVSIVVLAAIAAFVIHIFLSLPDVSDLKTHNPETTSLMELRKQLAEKQGTEFKVIQNWVSFENIPQLLKETVRIAEDFSFYWHKGIDYEELRKSIKKNIREKKFARGGSTITQQLAKNLYLSTKKSLIRKIKEILIAKRLEKNLTKDRIFELYLNVIEMGQGVFGVQSASFHYFGYAVSELTLDKIVRLVAILPRPLRSDPRGSSPWLRWRCGFLLQKLRAYDYITEESYQETIRMFDDPAPTHTSMTRQDQTSIL
jgi:monofunctional biosynthetic peptidoglycan transglycosylase